MMEATFYPDCYMLMTDRPSLLLSVDHIMTHEHTFASASSSAILASLSSRS